MVKVDQDKCIGCGTCEMMCPEAFKLVKGKVKVKNAKAKCIEKAVKACPVKAIILK